MKKDRKKPVKPAACPKCGSENVVPIQYGLPNGKMSAQWRRGEIELGGCCIGPGIPLRLCVDCKERFDRLGVDEGSDRVAIDGIAAVF